jgi:hypothetical protein
MMTNGNGLRRIHPVAAAAGTLLLAALMLPTPAAAIVPDTPCNEKCLADYAAAAEKCTEIKNNEEARKSCNDEAHKRYMSCRESCARNKNDLRECLDECEYKKGRDDEACARKRDPIERKQCFAEAMQKYADCKRECHKKYPEK